MRERKKLPPTLFQLEILKKSHPQKKEIQIREIPEIQATIEFIDEANNE